MINTEFKMDVPGDGYMRQEMWSSIQVYGLTRLRRPLSQKGPVEMPKSYSQRSDSKLEITVASLTILRI